MAEIVYVLQGGNSRYLYGEGNLKILGVFSSEEKAKEAIPSETKGKSHYDTNQYVYLICQFRLDETPKERRERLATAAEIMQQGMNKLRQENRQAVIDAGLLDPGEYTEGELVQNYNDRKIYRAHDSWHSLEN